MSQTNTLRPLHWGKVLTMPGRAALIAAKELIFIPLGMTLNAKQLQWQLFFALCEIKTTAVRGQGRMLSAALLNELFCPEMNTPVPGMRFGLLRMYDNGAPMQVRLIANLASGRRTYDRHFSRAGALSSIKHFEGGVISNKGGPALVVYNNEGEVMRKEYWHDGVRLSDAEVEYMLFGERELHLAVSLIAVSAGAICV